MKKFILLIGAFTICFPLFAKDANAHSKRRTKYGSVNCLDYKGNIVHESYCIGQKTQIFQGSTATGTHTTSKPATPTKRCSESHSHQDSTGGSKYVDTDGDGITDTAAIDAPDGTYDGGSSTLGGSAFDDSGRTEVSTGGNLLGGTTTTVGGNVDGGENDSEWDPDG